MTNFYSLLDQIITHFLSTLIITAAITWFAKLFITKIFESRVEAYKSNLQKDLEDHRSHLYRLTTEHQIKFTKLHEERASRIRALYKKVVELENSLIYTTVVQYTDDISYNKNADVCISKTRNLIRQLDIDRIYFTKDTITKFDKIIAESWDIIFKVRKASRYTKNLNNHVLAGTEAPEIYYSEADLWDEAERKTQTEFRLLKEELADDFRILLGL